MKFVTRNRIDHVMAEIKAASSYKAVNAVLAPFRRGPDNVSVVGEYRLQFGTLNNLQRECDGLMRVQHLNLSSAPRVVELLHKDELYGVLITRIDGVRDAELRSEAFGAGEPLTTDEVRASLRADVEKLREAGMWNHAFERGGCWYLNPETKRVFISPWFPVVATEARALQEGSAQVLRMIDHA
jgi:hypothetical protein